MRSVVVLCCSAVLVTAGVVPVAAATHQPRAEAAKPAPTKPVAGDFDGDGKSDLIINQDGSMRVYYTSADPAGDDSHVQDISLPDGSGASAVGDFNGDGYADLAVGSPFANGGPDGPYDGQVVVYYGSFDGLNASDPTVFPGTPGKGKKFGGLAEAIDLNQDGITDLIVNYGKSHNTVLLGSKKGLSTKNTEPLPTKYDGDSVIGDINHDGHPDLVVGNAYAGKASKGIFIGGHRGQISVFYGTKHGFANKPHVITGKAAGVGYGSLGNSISLAKVNGDNYADVVTGAFSTQVGERKDAGAVVVLYGGKSGLSVKHKTVLDLADKGAPTTPHATDLLGDTTVAADVNGDGYADVIAGDLQLYGHHNGQALVFRGSKQGLTMKHAQLISASGLGDIGTNHTDAALYGEVIVPFHPNGSKYASVAFGAPNYSTEASGHLGFADVYPGSKSGLTTHGAVRYVGTQEDEFLGGLIEP